MEIEVGKTYWHTTHAQIVTVKKVSNAGYVYVENAGGSMWWTHKTYLVEVE